MSGGDVQPITDPGGNIVSGFAINPSGDLFGYSEGAHSSACVSMQRVVVATTDVRGGIALEVSIPEVANQTDNAAFFVKGFAFATNIISPTLSSPTAACQAGTGPSQILP